MAVLRAIVSVDEKYRVRCGEDGCGHSIYKAIHVVQDGNAIFVLGSTCFERRYGGLNALGKPSYGSGSGRQLTDAEREMLTNNTQALLARFQVEDEEKARVLLEQERLQMEALSRRISPPIIPRPAKPSSVQTLSTGSFNSPWPWAKPGRSMLYIRFPDGSAWIRVEHQDGSQRLVPWPKLEGWDETWPTAVGTVDAELGCLKVSDIESALNVLRMHASWEKVCGSWREMSALLSTSGSRRT
jgi:hypothetical protein